MDRMKIIHLVGNKEWGGGEQYVLDLTERLRQDGYPVQVVCRASEAVESRFGDAKVLRLGSFLDFGSARGLKRMIEASTESKVVIHVHNFKTALHAVRAKRQLQGVKDVRVVMTRHLVKPGKNDHLSRFVYDNLDQLIFVSNLARDRFLDSNPRIDESKLRVVHNSVRRQLPNNPAFYERLHQEGEVALGFLGRIAEGKGLELLFEALSLVKCSNWYLHIAGTGAEGYINQLKRHAENLGISNRISWCGFVSDPAVMLKGIDVGVFPSVAEESFGLALIDFMQFGIPVVSTDTGAQREIIEDGYDGLLVPTDAAEMAKRLELILTDKRLRQRLGDAAFVTAQRFSYEEFYKKILETYNDGSNSNNTYTQC